MTVYHRVGSSSIVIPSEERNPYSLKTLLTIEMLRLCSS